MAKKQERLPAGQVKEDKDAFKGFGHIKNYKPNNDKYSRSKGTVIDEELAIADDEFTKAEEAYTKALSRINKAERRMHDFVQGMKDQVVSQFGHDSDEVTMV